MHILAEMPPPVNVTHRFKNGMVSALNLSVVEVYSFPFSTPGVSRGISTPEWAVEYHDAYAGAVIFLNPGGNFPIKRGERTVHLYSPGCLFTEDTRKSVLPRREAYMRFKGGGLCGLGKFTGSRGFCRFTDRGGRIGALLEKAAAACSAQGEGAFWEAQSALINCISIMLKASPAGLDATFEIPGGDSPEDRFVEDAESYIRRNIHRPVRNSELAYRANLSESTFNHRFKERTGASPGQRVLQVKIDTAKNLLLKGKGLKEVAQLTGFHDAFHLSRTFRKFTGEPPAQFRSRAGASAGCDFRKKHGTMPGGAHTGG